MGIPFNGPGISCRCSVQTVKHDFRFTEKDFEVLDKFEHVDTMLEIKAIEFNDKYLGLNELNNNDNIELHDYKVSMPSLSR